MRDLIAAFLDTTKERIKNPFIGAFVFSWIAFNWKPILIIFFSNMKVVDKIALIEKEHTSLTYNMWFPLFFAIFYVLILPYLMWLFDRISSKAVLGRKQSLFEQQIFDLQSKQRLAEQESRLEDIRASFRETADLNQKIDVLTNQIAERDNTIESLKSQVESAQEDQERLQTYLRQQDNEALSNEQIAEYKKEYEEFKESDLYEFFKEVGSEIVRRNNVPYNMDLVIEKFRHKEIIKEIRDDVNQNVYYEFTSKGKYFWKEFILSLKFKKNEEEDDDLPF
ncbi:coiled-coil domain-containing protein [Flagellimonas sp.]|uniref:coiled-coil domain-containing protein n=1 Tax=Flagellimonas sp. TaxID=2058762 RepID=UPI003BAD164C